MQHEDATRYQACCIFSASTGESIFIGGSWFIMNEMIKVFDIQSYPQHLIHLIENKRYLFNEYAERVHAANNLLPFNKWYSDQCGIEADYRELQSEFLNQLAEYWIEGFHITRTFPDESFLKKHYWKYGLCLPDCVFTGEYITDILSRIDGSPAEKDAFRKYFEDLYQNATEHDNADFSFSSGKKTISIFSTQSKFALYDSSENMSILYGKNVLGEINRDYMDKIKESALCQSLIQRTCPHIIQLRFRIFDVVQETEAERYEYPQDFVINQLIGILVSRHFSPDIWNIHKNNSIFLAQLQNNVPPEQILSIEKLPQ